MLVANNLDFSQNQALNLRLHTQSGAPGSPVEGQIYHDSGASHMTSVYNGSGWKPLWAADDDMTSLTAETSIASDDVVLIYDTSASGYRKMTRANFIAGLGAGIANAYAGITAGGVTANASGGDTITLVTAATSGLAAVAADNGAGADTITFTIDDSRLTAVTTFAGADELGFNVNSTGQRKITMTNFQAQLSTNLYVKGVATTSGYIPTWNGTTGNQLAAGYSVETSLTGSSTAIPRADAVKTYIDAAVQGIKTKASVRAATTAAGTLASSFANGQSIDGVTLVTNDRILIKNQGTSSENGIYTVNASGAPTRATDADIWDELRSAYVFVEVGTAQADTSWVCTVDAGGTLNSTAVTFEYFSRVASVNAGDGLVYDSSNYRINVETDNSTLELSATTGAGVVRVKDAGVTYAKIQNLTALSVLARSANSAGVSASVAATAASYNVLRESGSTIGFGSLDLSQSGVVGSSLLAVANGGTGRATSTTAYALIAAGTTATGAQQTLATGTQYQILFAGTAGALPTWSPYTMPSTVAINTMFYASSTSAISSITAVNNGVLVSNNSGVPSMLAGPGAATKVLLSNTSAAPSWSSASYLSATTANALLYSSATNVVAEITPAASAVLLSNGSSVPAWATFATARTTMSVAGYYSSATHGAGTSIAITAATHGLRASRGLLVFCVVESTGAAILVDVAIAANGDVTVTFAVSQSANTIRVTIVG
jgi:hypothetical protein